MSRVTIDVGRLDLALHGVSAMMAEAAVEGLDEALRRRLGRVPPFRRGAFARAELALGPAELGSVPDAGALRGILADLLAQAILSACAAGPDRPGGTT